jgi:hypothetical protein
MYSSTLDHGSYPQRLIPTLYVLDPQLSNLQNDGVSEVFCGAGVRGSSPSKDEHLHTAPTKRHHAQALFRSPERLC